MIKSKFLCGLSLSQEFTVRIGIYIGDLCFRITFMRWQAFLFLGFLAIYINIIIWGLIFVGFEFLYSQERDIFVIEFSGEKFITIFV